MNTVRVGQEPSQISHLKAKYATRKAVVIHQLEQVKLAVKGDDSAVMQAMVLRINVRMGAKLQVYNEILQDLNTLYP